MKILASCLIGLALFAGCSGCSTARPLPASLETANQSAFPVVLAPYQCRIFRISGPGGPLDEGPWWLDAIGYQVFSAAFDGGKLPTDRLDYLTNAGFDLIWSTPIFKSPSTHGYDAVDYYKIKDSFGGDAAFTRYAAEAEKRGVRIVLDLVLNHCGVGHPWFADSAARRFGKDDWFVWTDKPEGPWKDNWGRGGFPWTKHEERGQFYYHWFGRGMPDLNVVNPVVRAELEKIGRYWLEKGAAGYRLDAVRHLVETGPGEEKQVSTPESVAWLADYQAALVANEPEAYTIGEVWDAKITDSGPLWYHDGKANSQVFNFQFMRVVGRGLSVDSARGIPALVKGLDNPAIPPGFYAPFLDNHDDCHEWENRRAMDVVAGTGKKHWQRAKLAATLLYTFPGTPYTYYGTEIGMNKGSASGDAGKRTAMDWVEAERQLADPDSLLSHYRRLARLRRAESALRRGAIKAVPVNDQQIIAAYARPGHGETLIVVANFGPVQKDAQLDLSAFAVGVPHRVSEVVY